VARIVRESFVDREHLPELLGDLERRAREESDRLGQDRERLTGRMASLDGKLREAIANLAHTPPDLQADLADYARKLKAERADVARQLEGLEAIAEAGEEHAELVKDALKDLINLEARIGDLPAPVARTLFARWIEKVTLTFRPPMVMKNGKGRNVLDYIDIDFTPEAAYLLPSVP
jgi:hypothetical protein